LPGGCPRVASRRTSSICCASRARSLRNSVRAVPSLERADRVARAHLSRASSLPLRGSVASRANGTLICQLNASLLTSIEVSPCRDTARRLGKGRAGPRPFWLPARRSRGRFGSRKRDPLSKIRRTPARRLESVWPVSCEHGRVGSSARRVRSCEVVHVPAVSASAVSNACPGRITWRGLSAPPARCCVVRPGRRLRKNAPCRKS
jgi:hypothetical protein